ncbi:hypothetical protein [Thermofilum sp.]|uniref:hypothetical protein n=1 Tax=Thermofilum sp. TaxID=1961369 RepID=UPI00317E4FE7
MIIARTTMGRINRAVKNLKVFTTGCVRSVSSYIRRSYFDYFLRYNDLSLPASRCHEILSRPDVPPRQRCEAAFICAKGLVAIISPGDLAEKARVKAEVEKCVSETLQTWREAAQWPECATAMAYIECAKEASHELVKRVVAEALGKAQE